MTSLRWLRTVRGQSIAVGPALVSVAYIALLGPPGAIESAEGCTAGAPSTDSGLELAFPHTESGSIPVGRDGFVTLKVDGQGSADAVLERISIQVRNEAGDLIVGKAKELRSVQGSENFSVMVGWQSDAELPSGELLDASATAEGASKMGKLLVRDEVAEIEAPSFTLDDWRMVIRDTGAELACVAETSCGQYEAKVGSELERVTAASLRLEFPQAPVTVAWTFTTEEVVGKGSLVASATWDTLNHRLGLGDVAFRGNHEEYCVRVVARDLRGGEARATEVCSEPEAGLMELNQDRIDQCLTPPKGLEARWCEEHPDRRECKEVDPGPGGSAGAVETNTKGGSGGTPVLDEDSPQPNEPQSAEGSGCSIAPSMDHRESGVVFLAGLALGASFLVRRRRTAA